MLSHQGGHQGYSREGVSEPDHEKVGGFGVVWSGAHVVQMDFTEGRLSIKLDPSRSLLQSFIDLNNSGCWSASPQRRATKRFGDEHN